MGSLLTAPPSEIQAEIDASATLRRQTREQAEFLAFQCFLTGYRDGDIDFEGMCRGAALVLVRLDDEAQSALLGRFGRDALVLPAPSARRARRGLPYVIRDAIRQVTDAVVEREGLGTSKGGPLFERVAEVFSDLGLPQTASQIYRAYYPD